jgi:hypothetical protein
MQYYIISYSKLFFNWSYFQQVLSLVFKSKKTLILKFQKKLQMSGNEFDF